MSDAGERLDRPHDAEAPAMPGAEAAAPVGAEPGSGRVAGAPAAPGPGVDAPEGGQPGSGSPDAATAGEPGPDTGGPDAVAEVARQRDEYLDALRRLQADFENYKKRVARQQADQLARAAEGLIDKLLPVLDTADLALAHGGGDEIKQLSAALLDTLEREGLERIDPLGAQFDPNLHDAVAHEPGEGDDPEVVEVLRAGYRWKGRVLRPAMVKVRG